MISHNEALALISARQDQILDPIVEHELSAHLATCDSCRAFAQATDALTQGLRTLPYMPASPTVRRAVLDRVEQGRSPWARISGMFPASPGPALSTFALIALVLIVGFFALNRFVLQDPGGSERENRLASQPTAQVTATETAEITVTAEPTETVTNLVAEATETPTDEATEPPTEETATEETATEAPTTEPTAEPTREPTEAPTTEPTVEPTATSEPTPAPTKTPVPTQAPKPTATDEPQNIAAGTTERASAEPTAEDIVDLTIDTATETPEPTATPTTEPTQEPTATPTNTPEPTPKPTATTEPTPEPTEKVAPQIVPIESTGPVDNPTPEPTRQADDTTSSADTPPIEPVNGQTITGPDGGTEQIEPADATVVPEDEVTPEPAIGSTETDNVQDLVEASERYQDLAGEPGGRLVLTNEGRMILGDQPHAPELMTPAGRTLQTVSAEGGDAVALCDDAGSCTDVSSGSREGAAQDAPLGIIGADAIYVRTTGDTIEYRRSAVEGDTVLSDELLYSGSASDAPQGAVYYESDRLWIPTTGGNWVELGSDQGTLLPGGYADPQLVRFADTSQGLLVGYVSGGQLIIAPAENPGSPVLALPFNGADFDISPRGDRVVISTGSSIDIYDLGGTMTVSYSSGERTPGTVLWLNSGVVYVDQATGAIYQIPETAS